MTGQPSTVEPDMPPQRPQQDGGTDAAELVLEDRFSMVPEWLLDADIGDCAVRLYAVLLRYGNTTGARMPARTTLADRLHKKSTDTVVGAGRAGQARRRPGREPVDRRPAAHQPLPDPHIATRRWESGPDPRSGSQ